jgi:NTE family protein
VGTGAAVGRGVGDAFVLGGGGVLGAAEAGMALALLEAGVVPGLVCGTSIGAINGVAIAADPTPRGARALMAGWDALVGGGVPGGSGSGGSGSGGGGLLGGTAVRRVVELVRSGTSLHGNERLRDLLCDLLPVREFERLAVPFECVAARIEDAREHWFGSGDLVTAVLASCALPGVFPPVCVDGAHYLDGGLVNSIPLDRAVRGGARTVWVLHAGRVEEQLAVPRFPWQVGFVAFEIARRHRFHTDLARVPDGVTVHVLPTGQPPRRAATWSNLRYRDPRRAADRAERAHRATAAYLDGLA